MKKIKGRIFDLLLLVMAIIAMECGYYFIAAIFLSISICYSMYELMVFKITTKTNLEQRRKFFKKHKRIKRVVIIVLFPVCIVSVFLEVIKGRNFFKEIKKHIAVTKEMWGK